jgi:hypothetical protein
MLTRALPVMHYLRHRYDALPVPFARSMVMHYTRPFTQIVSPTRHSLHHSFWIHSSAMQHQFLT